MTVPEPIPPQVGPPSDDYRAVCAFSLRPGMPQCEQAATVHVQVVSYQYGPVALASCDQHADVARAADRCVQEHAFEGYCGLPGTLWSPTANRCVLDDSGQEPAVGRVAEAVAG